MPLPLVCSLPILPHLKSKVCTVTRVLFKNINVILLFSLLTHFNNPPLSYRTIQSQHNVQSFYQLCLALSSSITILPWPRSQSHSNSVHWLECVRPFCFLTPVSIHLFHFFFFLIHLASTSSLYFPPGFGVTLMCSQSIIYPAREYTMAYVLFRIFQQTIEVLKGDLIFDPLLELSKYL